MPYDTHTTRVSKELWKELAKIKANRDVTWAEAADIMFGEQKDQEKKLQKLHGRVSGVQKKVDGNRDKVEKAEKEIKALKKEIQEMK